MKKTIFSLAMVMAMGALAFTACQEKEVVDTFVGDAITFNTVLNKATKATATTTDNLSAFVVDAYKVTTEDDSTYFANVTFTKGSDNTFKSATSYYWPKTGNLNFYAYAPAADAAQVVKTDFKTFTITPSTTPSSQVDFIYAAAYGKNKAANAAGVALNFRHAESQIVVKVKNSSSALKFVVDGWKVANVKSSGTFTYNGSVTATNGAATFAATTWTAGSSSTSYTSSFSAEDVDASAAADVIGDSMILIPQEVSKATEYSAQTDGAAVTTGSYIAVKVKILNAEDGSRIFPATDVTAWAMWPVDINWAPGYKYVYTVDLATGGYYEDNSGDEPNDPDNPGTVPDDVIPDPILDTPIQFINVTVDVYKDGVAVNIDALPSLS